MNSRNECGSDTRYLTKALKQDKDRVHVSRLFILQTDRGIGAVLSQRDDQNIDHSDTVGYYSRKLLAREEKYSTIEKECLAIKLGVQAFRVYLLGRDTDRP